MCFVISVTLFAKKSTGGHSKEYLKGIGNDFSSVHCFEFSLFLGSLLHVKFH